MKLRNLLIIIMLVLFASFLFAQNQTDIATETNEPVIENTAYDSPVSPTTEPLRALAVDAMALFAYTMLTAVCGFLSRLLLIKINEKQVIASITEITGQAKTLATFTDEQKKQYSVEQLKNNKSASKWAKIIYGSLGGAVEFVFREIVKKGSKK